MQHSDYLRQAKEMMNQYDWFYKKGKTSHQRKNEILRKKFNCVFQCLDDFEKFSLKIEIDNILQKFKDNDNLFTNISDTDLDQELAPLPLFR